MLLAFSATGCSRPDGRVDLSDLNLLLISIDTLRSDRLGAYGDSLAETPRLDDLAERGIRFENVYTHVPLTLPAHSTLFTGKYPFAHGVRTNGSYALRREESTLAEVLQSRGFHTSAIVSSFILSGKFGLEQGFESYDDGLGEGELLRGFTSEIGASEVAAKFLRHTPSLREPFFAFVHFYDPHQPYDPPEPYRQRFASDPYRGEVAYVDAQVGAILDGLREGGLLERTLVVVTSDHGEGFGEHVEVGHGFLAYEEVLRVPLILAAAEGRLAAKTVEDRVRLVDLMPTLLELFGIESPAGVQGESFADLILEPDASALPPREVYFETMLGRDENNWAPLTGLISGDYKYISLPESELYALDHDPGELENLFTGRPDLAQKLDSKLQALWLSNLGSDAADGGHARRQPTAEDFERLEALGYVSSSSARTTRVIDPKRGIRLERQLQRVREHLAVGALDEAFADLDRLSATSEELGVGSYYFLLHQLSAARNDPAAATAALEAGRQRFPDREQFPFLLAHYQLQLGRPRDAEHLAREALAMSPDFSPSLILLGQALEAQERVPEAIAAYRRAADLEPANTPLKIRLAGALARSGDGPAALETYDQLLAAGALDSNADELARAAALNSHFSRLERAESLFRRSLRIHPTGMSYLSFAIVLAQQGRIEEAASQMKTALRGYREELSPEQVEVARRALQEWGHAP